MPRANKGYIVKERSDRPGSWEVGEYVKGKWKRRRTGLGSAEEAQNERYSLERQDRIGHVFAINERMIGDMIADYIDERRNEIQSKVTFDLAIEKLLPYWGGKPVSYITETSCNGYYAFRNKKKKLSDSTIGRELRTLRAAINRDFNMGRIEQNRKVWIRKEVNKKSEPPSRKEIILMARKSKPGSARRRYILIAFYTGARKGAVLSLRWNQVSLQHINFNASGSQSNKKRVLIPMNRKLKSFMRIWRKYGTDIGPVIHRHGRPIEDVKDAPTHLRAAAAVQMLISGIAPYKVALYLGHSVEVLQKHYGHLIPGHLDEAAEALG